VQNPAITSERIHYFFKEVSGVPFIRPSCYFDVEQEGEGLVDLTSHLVDLIQWQCFPEQVLTTKGILRCLLGSIGELFSPLLSFISFKKDTYPDFLWKTVKDSLLSVYANGEMNYEIKGTHAKVDVVWNFKAPDGTGDTYYSMLRGTKANLIIRQGKEQQYKPSLYIGPVDTTDENNWNETVQTALKTLVKKVPPISISRRLTTGGKSLSLIDIRPPTNNMFLRLLRSIYNT
jgi:predicted dehydrogenase